MKKTLLLLLFVSGLVASAADLTPEEINELPHQQIEKELTSAHPSSYYLYASRLFTEEKKDDAIFWFYVGQLRYRVHLLSKPELEPSGDPALFGSLNATIGLMINEYAGGDPQMWVSQMNRALSWDEQNKNRFTPKKKNKAQYEETRKGLKGLIASMESQFDEIRAQRAANGLENRN